MTEDTPQHSDADTATPEVVDACARCAKPPTICVCERTVELTTKTNVLILQHPQESDVELGSAPLLLTSLPRARRVIGLSWPSLRDVLSHVKGGFEGNKLDEPRRWGVLYPSSLQRELSAKQQAAPFVALDKSGWEHDRTTFRGIVVLDGTWSQVKTLWWRNSWLLKLGRIVIHPREASIYGRARREPKREYVSTLEAVALSLDGLGEDPEVGEQLRRLFRTMVQRGRDASTKPPVRRRSRAR